MDRVCVLVVEDNLDVGSFVADGLAELGCKSAPTTNADEALAGLNKGPNRFDVAFSRRDGPVFHAIGENRHSWTRSRPNPY
jgi:CheY-like chemotaxis protein